MKIENELHNKFSMSYMSLIWGLFTMFFIMVYGIAFYSVYPPNPLSEIDMYAAMVASTISMVFVAMSRKNDREKV